MQTNMRLVIHACYQRRMSRCSIILERFFDVHTLGTTTPCWASIVSGLLREAVKLEKECLYEITGRIRGIATGGVKKSASMKIKELPSLIWTLSVYLMGPAEFQ